MNYEIAIIALIFCTLGWIPIIATGKAIALIVEACNRNNICKKDDALEDVKIGQ